MERLQTIIEQQSSQDEEIRRRAVISLLAYPIERIKSAIFHAMGDSSWRVRKEAVEAVSAADCSESLMEDLVVLLRDHDNAGLRNSAVEALRRIGKRAVPVLSRHLKDTDHDVRKFIVDILGDITAADSLPLLFEALDDPDQNVCASAIENIGKIGDAGAVEHLLKCLSMPDMMLRFTALQALVRIGKPVPLAELLPFVQDSFLKRAVFDCFALGVDAEAVPYLLNGLSENKAIRESAACALAGMRARLSAVDAHALIDRPLAELKGSPAVAGLIASLGSAESQVKDSLVTILAAIGDGTAAPALLNQCRDGRSSRQLISAFASMGDTGASYLIGAFADSGCTERRFIAYACGELRFRNCADLFRQGLKDSDPELRAICATAAGQTGQTVILDDLADLVDDEEPYVREAAVTALSLLAESARDTVLKLAQTFAASSHPEKRRNAAMLFAVLHDTEKLSLLLKDEAVTVRKAAVLSLSDVGKSGLNQLVMALVDEDAEVRIAAAQSLGERGENDALEPLVLALKDADPWVITEVLKSLGRLGDERALPAVEELIGAADAPVVIAALESFTAINPGGAAGRLTGALDHADEEVVKRAMELLSGLDDGWVDDFADKLLNHPHWDVRRTFARIISILWGKRALPILQAALDTETDMLVKRQLAELVERMQ